jgi:hypothetical protein
MSKANISPSTDNEFATVELTSEQQIIVSEFVEKLLDKKRVSAPKRRKFFVTENETLTEEARAHVEKNILKFPF